MTAGPAGTKTKIVYTISLVAHSRVFEWTAELLSKEKYELVFILMHSTETPLELFLRKHGFRVYRVHYTTKKNLPGAVLKIRRILKREKPAIVHTHLFEAGLAGMAAAKLAGIKTRIHTRHDATIHHLYHPQAVKYDRFTNRCSTHLVAITESVKNILRDMEQVSEKKITIIHHGFKLEEFAQVSQTRIDAMSRKYFPGGKKFRVLGIVSRFIEWKGIQYIIPAFRKLLEQDENVHLVFVNAVGPYTGELDKLLRTLPKEKFTLIPFETDIPALYHLFDIFIHVPVDAAAEAFGQVYVEAMAAGVPSVITRSGITCDYVTDRKNALVVPYRDPEKIEAAVNELLHSPELAASIAQQASADVAERFGIEKMINALEELYDR